MSVTAKAYAKINWFLNIEGVLENGYHEMDMLMQPISLCDTLEFSEDEDLSLVVDGVAAGEDNLVLKAARALKECAKADHLGARISLNKKIPARAGLGGGSADCAETLKTLNRLWNLNYPMEKLLAIGEKLGADVPFCLIGGLARVRGFGERVEPYPEAPKCALTLITPGGGLSTPAVFREWDVCPSAISDQNRAKLLADALVCGRFKCAEALSFNALEAPAIRLLPKIGEWIRIFREHGSEYVRMSGSGSTVFAVFDSLDRAKAVAAQFPNAIAAETMA